MPNTPRFAMATAAIVIVAIAGALSLSGFAGTAGPGANPPPAITPSPAPTDTSSPAATIQSQALGSGPLAAGRHHIDVDLYSYRYVTTDQDGDLRVPGGTARVSFEVPTGWTGNGWAAFKQPVGEPIAVSIAPWTIGTVFQDPCQPSVDFVDPPLMRSPDGLATALTTWSGTESTGPTDVTLAGFPGYLVEMRAPTELDVTACQDGRYTLWLDTDGEARYIQGPGQLDRVWILDVGPGGPYSTLRAGELVTDPNALKRTLVIDAGSLPEASEQDLAELQGVIDSIEIVFHDISPSRPLGSGTHRIPTKYAYMQFEVPAGWLTDDQGRIFKGAGEAPGGIGMQIGTVSGVYADPCLWSRGLSDADMSHGPSHPAYVEMANALAGDLATPEVENLAGWGGLKLTLTTPLTIDDCDDGQFRRWEAAPGRPTFTHRAGQLDEIWLLDPDREMVLVHVWSFDDTSAEDRAEMLEILDSMSLMWGP